MRLKTLKAAAAAAVTALSLGAFAPSASAGTDLYIGEIFQVGYNWCPKDSLPADGQSIKISDNTALFSLLGTAFGGNGTTHFNLPDLRGRSIVHQGQGPNLSYVMVGESGGAETVTLTTANLPAHTHPSAAGILNSTLKIKGKSVWVESYSGDIGSGVQVTSLEPFDSTSPTSMEYSNSITTPQGVIGTAGSSTPVPIRSPYLVMNTCIAIYGTFPSRPY